jgi:tRNA nucleotidyltransferase/poly(A) polymerase
MAPERDPRDAPDPLALARRALAGRPAWLVGGAVRDRLLGRPTFDLDVVVEGPAEPAAKALGREARAAAFPLSDAFGVWRVIAREDGWQVDLLPVNGRTIEEDLAARDFTVNAIAEPLAGGEPIDPFGGRADLAAGRLRMVGDQAFAADPLRVLRAARLACELHLEPEPDTRAAALAAAPALHRVAPERIFAELRRIVTAPEALRGLAEMDRLGATAVVLPELDALRGVQQSAYHHLDVYEHTLAVLEQAIAIERDPEALFGPLAPDVAALLAEPLADELDRGGALRFGALLHDAAKPATRAVTAEGRITFIGHDRTGAALSRDVLARLHTSERLRAHVAALTRNHLRLGFLVHQRPLDRRAVYAYLTACEPVAADVTVLSVADRLATRGRKADEAIVRHLGLARELLAEALRFRRERPAPLVRGDDLAAALGIAPGPEVGRLLAEIAEAQFAGEVTTRDEALRFVRATAPRFT